MPGRNNGFILGAGYSVTYGYDAATGRFGGLDWTAGSKSGSVNYGYVENSELLGSVTAGNIATTYTYEPHRNLKTRVENAFNPSVVSAYEYRYDELGRRTSVVNTGVAFDSANRTGFNKYGYNDRSEVTESKRYQGADVDDTGLPVDPETRLYEYDPIGNREQATEGTAETIFYNTNEINQYTRLTGAVSADPGYDPDGNMTAYDGKEYAWNGENRLVAVTPVMPAEGDQKVAFVYDYLGRRVKKAVYAYGSGGWELQKEILFVYDGWNLVREKEVSAAGEPFFDKFYVWGLDLSQSLQGAGGIGGLVCRVSGGEVRHYLYDANGNVGQMVDPADGAISARYEYDPFGNAVFVDGADAAGNAFRFSTKYWDSEGNLYYYGYRYHSPELSRWISRDPIEEAGGLNLYGFVGNEPVGRWDYLGKAVHVAYRRMANSLSFLWDLGRRGGHVYLVFDEEFEENAERCCWDQTIRELDVHFIAPYTFSYHPESVVNPESDLNRKNVLVTDGSAVDINNLLNDIEPFLDGRAAHWQITNDPCVQAAIFRRAFISAGRHNECGSCADQFGHYSGSYKNCGGWAKYIIEGAGGDWPSELSREINSGTGVEGPMHVPGMVLYGVSRAIVEIEPVDFSVGSEEPSIYPGWTYEFP